MDWIFEHLNIVIIIGVVIASIFKTQFEAKKKEAEEREVESEERSRTPLDQDKSYRKTPPSAPSVPPPLTRTNIPASGSTPPPLVYTMGSNIPGAASAAAEEAARMLKHQQDLAAHLKQIHDTKATTTGGAAATRARIASKGKTQTAASAPLTLRARLKSPAEIRRAFVMNEILSRPVGLR